MNNSERITTKSKTTIIDGYVYICKGPQGALLSSPVWQIQQISLTDPFVQLFADGNENFDNVATSPDNLIFS